MISIIIPLYNKEKTIIRTVDSILEQDYSDFEVIVVNDGSTDNSKIIIQKQITDPRVKLINKNNSGVSETRNVGVLNASGDWILFLDATSSSVDASVRQSRR